jgi:hypothetical protein
MLKSTLLASLFLSLSINFVHASALENALIEGVKFLDDVHEVEWYRVDGTTVIIGWKGLPQIFTRINRRAATRGTITTGKKVQVWAVRHNQKKWAVGSGKPFICSVSAKNGRVKTDTCPY